jgi:carnitine 3-dehydrogenase
MAAPEIKTVGLIGGGVIGGGWAARCALHAMDVVVFDTDAQARRKLDRILANARRAHQALASTRVEPEGTVRLVTDLEEACASADFIQESLPEREALKIELLSRASRAARTDVVIASSTSGLLPTRLQSSMQGPERFLVGHPFNPVYLMPLVEICPGAQTSAESCERAAAFYRSMGMKPLRLRKEIDAFIADRLMEALWREALWLVHEDVATVEEIDDAIRYGPGLRWALMGSFLVYRLGGGEAGMRHFLEQFGPSLKWPWSKLTDVPEFDHALIEKIANQSDAQAAGRSIAELERIRDDGLVAVIGALKRIGWGAGAVLKEYEQSQQPRGS